MSASKRSLRRHHRDRLKARARRILISGEFSSLFDPGWSEGLEHRVNRRWNNMSMCSCWMCGNPRRRYTGWNHAKLTVQEKKQFDNEKAQMDEVDNPIGL